MSCLKKFLVYLLASPLFFINACSVGPEYVPPSVALPSKWSEGSSDQTSPELLWWRHFHDPLLNELIEQKASCNLSIQVAQARVMVAQAEYAVAYAQLFPRASANLLPPSGTGEGLTQVIALSTFIEPDLFGKYKETRRKAHALVQAEEADRDAAILHLYEEIASSYLELREAQTSLDILQRNLASNQSLLHIITSRHRSGLVKYLDIAQQDGLIQTQLAEAEKTKAQILALIHKVEILVGQNPGILKPILSIHKPVPRIAQPITLNIPASLLLRRPDIIAAERRVAATHADIRIATANLFPNVNVLGWLFAWQTQTLGSSIFAMQSTASTLLATFNLPVLNLTLNRLVDVREREKAVAVVHYQLTVLRALHEVETQYNFSQYYLNSANYLKKAVEKKRLVNSLAKDSYEQGLSDFNTVLRAEEEVNRLETSYVHNIVIYEIARIKLYTALGG